MIHLEALVDASSMTVKQLAKKHGEEAARWALLQLELRGRAVRKFGDHAFQMLFEREALEQATGRAVAAYHAAAFPEGVAVLDLTAGIGGDALAMVDRGPVIAFETDEARAEMLRHNVPLAQVRGDDGIQFLSADPVPNHCWADPDRRSVDGRRLTRPEDYSPDPRMLANRLQQTVLSGIKLSPLLPDDYLESLGGRLEFISFRGECLEAVVWLGSSVKEVSRSAVLVGEYEEPIRLCGATLAPRCEAPGAYVFDVDPAVVRAHASGQFQISQLGDTPGYLTGSQPISHPALRPYQVLAETSVDPKKLRAALRANDWFAFELKQRGASLDPHSVLKGVPKGSIPVSLIAYRTGPKKRILVAKSIN